MNWWGEVNEADGINLLQKAAGKGITFFDTADTYGAGYGEEIMPKALADWRKDIIIGTKFGYDIEAPREVHKERPQVWDPEVRKASLRRQPPTVTNRLHRSVSVSQPSTRRASAPGYHWFARRPEG